MFDVGFSELMVIAVVALIVIGPERLPKVARTLGHLVGRLQRYVNDVKADINREIELDELRKFKNTFEDAAREMEHSVHNEAAKAESELDAIAQSVDAAATGGLTRPGVEPAEPQAKTELDTAVGSKEEAAKTPQREEQPGSAEQPQTAHKSPA